MSVDRQSEEMKRILGLLQSAMGKPVDEALLKYEVSDERADQGRSEMLQITALNIGRHARL